MPSFIVFHADTLNECLQTFKIRTWLHLLARTRQREWENGKQGDSMMSIFRFSQAPAAIAAITLTVIAVYT
ncbi:MAG: hypothetical protein V7750_11970, partial [Sneathiella sp.]